SSDLGALGSDDVGRRRLPRLLREQSLCRHGLRRRPLDRDHHRADHRRPRHAVRPDPRRLRADHAGRGDDLADQRLRVERPQAMVLRRRAVAHRRAAAGGIVALAASAARHRRGAAMSADALLEVRGISKRFRGLQAVDNVSFAVPRGGIVALIGPNGAGKTTTFNLIAGVFAPDRGSVVLDGADITGLRADQACRAGIARTFQVVKPFGGLTVLENVMVGAFKASHDPSAARDIALDILARLGLADKAEVVAKSLTLPERKRLEAARALA